MSIFASISSSSPSSPFRPRRSRILQIRSPANRRTRSSCAEEEARLTRVALAAGAATQLVVDPARLVPLGADDVEAADLFNRDAVGVARSSIFGRMSAKRSS